jgi:hypothetical protein
MHTIYCLHSEESELVRYVGCTVHPAKRLREHVHMQSLVSHWMAWHREMGIAIVMRRICEIEELEAALRHESKWIQQLSGPFLFNRESWESSQTLSGVPRSVQKVFKRLLAMSAYKLVDGEHSIASECMTLVKDICRDYPTLAIREPRLLSHAAFACSEWPVIAELEPLITDYQGATPFGFRLALTSH